MTTAGLEIILATAGLGDSKYVNAANRLVSQASKTGLFHKVYKLEAGNMAEFCPKTLTKYSKYLSSDTPGFGYWAWKSEFLQSLSEAHPNAIIFWVDAGCEMQINRISKILMNRIINTAKNKGLFIFSLETPEMQFSKRRIIIKINPNLIDDNSAQIQATWFAFSTSKTKILIDKWTESSLENIKNIDNSVGEEVANFISNRNDQSILSLLCKTLNYSPEKYKPVNGRSFRSKIRGILHPIWVCRNFTEKSYIFYTSTWNYHAN